MKHYEIKTKNGVTFIEFEREEVNFMYWFTGIAGFLLMAAPYIFNYADNQTAVWTSVIAGFIVLGVSVWEAVEKKKENWEYWIAGVVGVFATIAPFILGFGNHVSAMWTTVIMGAVITVLAGSKLWTGGRTS